MLSTNILALYVYKDYLLIAEGPNLHLVSLHDNHNLSTLCVLFGSLIHGIKKTNQEVLRPKFLVWGQKRFAIVTLYNEVLHFECGHRDVEIEDWIVDAACSTDDSYVILATAHNCLIKHACCSINENNKLETIKKECAENSLLYSGFITGVSWNACVVLSGTAFGKIHVWAPWASPDSGERITPIVSLSGPKGAIFSVTYDINSNLIAATSDDRSLRVWKVLFSNESNLSCSEYHNNWRKCSIEDIFCSFGHSARVWKSLILEKETFLTCGEDSTVCYWSRCGSLLDSWVAHPSSNVWCLTVNRDTVFTGGGDGAVKKWKLKDRNKGNLLCLSLPWSDEKKEAEDNLKKNETSLNTNEGQNKSSKEVMTKNFPRSINMVDPYTCVMVSNDGCVWLCKLSEKTWTLALRDPLLKGYIVTAISSDSTLLAFGTLTGHILICKKETLSWSYQSPKCCSKIQSLMFIDQDILISCTGFGRIQVWTIKNKDGNVCLEPTVEYVVPLCRQRWITAASFLHKEAQDRFYLAVGDPCGSVFLFTPSSAEPKSTLKGLHGRNGVTSVRTNKNVLLTTGRDGYLRYSVVREDGHLNVIYDLKLQTANWICGLLEMGRDVFVPSFCGEKLQIWNVEEEKLITEIDCGGGHRSWDILLGSKRFSCSGALDVNSEKGREIKLVYAFLRNGMPVLWESVISTDDIHPTIKSPISGREIQCVEPLFMGDGGVVLAFGGEDTLLHMGLARDEKMHKVSAIKSHLSSVRTITKIQQLGEEAPRWGAVDLISCGGRAQIKVWTLSLTGSATNLIHGCEESMMERDYRSTLLDPGVVVKEVNSHMLKAEGKHAWKSRSLNYDPETRYMDSLAFWVSADTALFILASSDGFIRFFKYSNETEFTLLHDRDCQFCLLRLCLLIFDDAYYVVASTTRGNIIVWDLEEILSTSSLWKSEYCSEKTSGDSLPFLVVAQHQVEDCGLNSLASYGDIMEVKYNHPLATGGDDGSIHLLKFSFSNAPSDHRQALLISPVLKTTAHAAQVSGLVWLDQNRLCSVSIDQRLILWRLDEHKLCILSIHFSHIADIQGLSLCNYSFDKYDAAGEKRTTKVFVFGTGIQEFDF